MEEPEALVCDCEPLVLPLTSANFWLRLHSALHGPFLTPVPPRHSRRVNARGMEVEGVVNEVVDDNVLSGRPLQRRTTRYDLDAKGKIET